MNVLLLAAALLFSGVKVALAAQFSAVSVLPSQFYIGQPVTVTAVDGADETYTLTATSIYEENGTTQTYSTIFTPGPTTVVTFPSASGATFGVTILTSDTTFSTTVTQYSPAIISPTDGATLTLGSTFLASVSVLPLYSSAYTITFDNGIYYHVSTIAGDTSVFPLSVPSNYIGSYTLQLTQGTLVDTVTYVQAAAVTPVWNPFDPNMLFRIGGIPHRYH